MKKNNVNDRKISRNILVIVLIRISITVFALLCISCDYENAFKNYGHGTTVEMSFTPKHPNPIFTNPVQKNTVIQFLFKVEDDGKHETIVNGVTFDEAPGENVVPMVLTPDADVKDQYRGSYTFLEGFYELSFNMTHDNVPLVKVFEIRVY